MTEVNVIKSVFKSKGLIYLFESDPFEPREQFIRRSWFIISYMEEHKTPLQDLDKIINLSRKWKNEQTIDAKYK